MSAADSIRSHGRALILSPMGLCPHQL